MFSAFVVFITVYSFSTFVNAIQYCNLSSTFFSDINKGCFIRNCKMGFDKCMSMNISYHTYHNYVGMCDSFEALTTKIYSYDTDDLSTSVFLSTCSLSSETTFKICSCDATIFDQDYEKLLSCNISSDGHECNPKNREITGCICGDILYYTTSLSGVVLTYLLYAGCILGAAALITLIWFLIEAIAPYAAPFIAVTYTKILVIIRRMREVREYEEI